MEALQYDHFGLYPVGGALVYWRHDLRRTRYDRIS